MKAWPTLVAFTAICGALTLLNACSQKPSRAALERNFYEHRSELERLAAMANEDRAGNLTPEDARSVGVSALRAEEYKRLFESAHISTGLTRYPSGDVFLVADITGIAVSGAEYGYLRCNPVQSNQTMAPCVEQKPEGGSGSDGRGYRYKRLDSNWYYYEEYR